VYGRVPLEDWPLAALEPLLDELADVGPAVVAVGELDDNVELACAGAGALWAAGVVAVDAGVDVVVLDPASGSMYC
jgi:hypothetical protein